MKYDFVFVILTYKNTVDILDFIESVKKYKNKKIILVNSYFDDKSKFILEEIARKNNCDFINVENKGYSYGNNIGIQYAIDNYDFEFLIISNPDIIVNNLDLNQIRLNQDYILGPIIRTSKNTNQNPYWIFEHKFIEYLTYKAAKLDLRFISFICAVYIKLVREIFILFNKNKINCFALHGSFVILSKDNLMKLNPLFDDKMFLFSEEMYLAHRTKIMNIKSRVIFSCNVTHKEDGSISLSNTNISKEGAKSIIYYYEKLKKRK